MVLDIVTYPAASLRKKSIPVKGITEEISELIKNMTDTLYSMQAYGVAAPQVGRNLRIVVLDEGGSNAEVHKTQVYVNPEILEANGEIVGDEGCLSLPGEYCPVKRFARLKVRAMDETGSVREVDAEGQLARILQHEIDHLEGVLFIDKIPAFRRDIIKKHIKRRIQEGDYVVYEA
ncbi:peptide deformylase [Deferribacterales bacterium RsTz2092]|nr:peptide deformylase [Deferribacterales bacterium]